MTTRRFSYDPANADDNGLANDLPTGSAWVFGVDAEYLAQSCGDGLAHRLIATTIGDEPAGNAAVLTVTGTDADGNTISDAMTLPNAGTVESSEYFASITTLVTQADTINTFDLGWVDEFVSETVYLDEEYPSNWQINLTGTISIDTDWSLKDFRRPPSLGDQNSEPWMDGSGVEATLDAETVDSAAVAGVEAGYVAMRFRVNSYTDTAEFDVYLTQASRRYNATGLPG